MHYFKYLPFKVASSTELYQSCAQQGIDLDRFGKTVETEYMGLGCELSFKLHSGKVTYYLRIYPTLTGRSVDGILSRRNTSDWMKTLYERMKIEYGEPSIQTLVYGHLNIDDTVTTSEEKTNRLNPSRADESVNVIFDNITLSHSFFDNDGDLTSSLTVTFRAEE